MLQLEPQSLSLSLSFFLFFFLPFFIALSQEVMDGLDFGLDTEEDRFLSAFDLFRNEVGLCSLRISIWFIKR
jgi:hypothetical protein